VRRPLLVRYGAVRGSTGRYGGTVWDCQLVLAAIFAVLQLGAAVLVRDPPPKSRVRRARAHTHTNIHTHTCLPDLSLTSFLQISARVPCVRVSAHARGACVRAHAGCVPASATVVHTVRVRTCVEYGGTAVWAAGVTRCTARLLCRLIRRRQCLPWALFLARTVIIRTQAAPPAARAPPAPMRPAVAPPCLAAGRR
jgi:hypothetical protein